jgi:hypothetical protein
MDQPIACTLGARDAAARAAQLRALADRALTSREPTERGERLTFDAGAASEHELRDVIAAEAACCAFLQLDLHRAGGSLVLDIAGPAGARPVIAALFASGDA